MTDSVPTPQFTSLPTPLTSFVGREHDIAQVSTLVQRESVRLVTLTGPGGVGKTRLALRVAVDLAAAYADGIALVSLAAVSDPTLVVPTIAEALGLQAASASTILQRLIDHLRDAELLLVLDNVEQVVEAAPLLTGLLDHCPRLQLLVTSRVRLRVSGEHEVVVAPLPLPTRSPAGSLEDARASAAIQLFLLRAQALAPELALTAETVEAIAAICQRLDGLPLAIELAAARTKHLAPAALLVRLEQRLPVLTGGPRDAPARQRTMRDAIAWSDDLLAPHEQALFRHLSVLVGGFDLPAAAAVTPGTEDLDLLDGVAALLDHSLLQHEPGRTGEPRYRMLETIREYGLERLAASGEAETIQQHHADYCVAFAEAVATTLWDLGDPALTADPASGLLRMDLEQDNLRAALGWAVARGDDVLLIRLAVALKAYWLRRGRLGEGRTWVDRAAEAAGHHEIPVPLQAAAFLAAGWFARVQGDHPRADLLGQLSLARFRDLDDAANMAEALEVLGLVAEDRGEFRLAQARHEEALALLLPLDEPVRLAMTMRHVGWSTYLAGDVSAGERWLQDALTACHRVGYTHGAATASSDLARIVLDRGEYARAAELLQARLGLTWDAWGLCFALEQLAEVAAACGESTRAARLFGAAEAHRERIGATLPQGRPSPYEPSVVSAQAALGEDGFAAAWAAGRALALDEARAEAALVARVPALVTPASEVGGPAYHGLTPRERDVLRLLAEGHTDREIADALSITYRTTTSYVRNILTRLDLASRTAAATYAVRHGLV